MSRIVILGAGMAGFGASHFLQENHRDAVVFEKSTYYGGHAASFSEGGFIFDDGPHVSFTKIKRLQEILADNVKGELEEVNVKANNYWQGHWVKHPAQCNLYGLPVDLVTSIITEISVLQPIPRSKLNNYQEWLFAHFGETFSRTFPMQYGSKYHTLPAAKMSLDWIGPRLYQADLEEVVRGALSPATADVHYVTMFRYPTHGGFGAFVDAFYRKSDVRLEHQANRISYRDKTVSFSNGFTEGYSSLISSIPLPELIRIIDDVPQDVRDAAEKLACSTSAVVNIGLDRRELSDSVWTYFYDDDIIFTRISFPAMMSPNVVPEGMGSIQAEVYYSDKYKPIDRTPDQLVDPVIRDLRKCGLIREKDTITFTSSFLIPYANIIFDLERKSALYVVHGFLDDVGIAYCGRYGDWGYQWTDQSFVSGEKAAASVL